MRQRYTAVAARPPADEFLDEIAANLLGFVSTSELLLHRLEIYQTDLSLLQDSWRGYCSKGRLSDVLSLYNPTSLFMPSSNISTPTSSTPALSVQVRVSFHEGGEARGGLDATHHEGELRRAGAEIACAYFNGSRADGTGGGGSSCGDILELVWDFVSDPHRLDREVDKYNELTQIIDSIYQLQKNSILNLQKRAPAMIQSVCRDFFSEERLTHADVVAPFQSAVIQFRHDANLFLESKIPMERKILRGYLEGDYFPEVIQTYTSLVESHYQARRVSEEQLLEYLFTHVAQALQRVAESSDDLEVAKEQHSLWDELIRADAQFNNAPDFVWSEQSSSGFVDRWRQIVKDIGQEALREKP